MDTYKFAIRQLKKLKRKTDDMKLMINLLEELELEQAIINSKRVVKDIEERIKLGTCRQSALNRYGAFLCGLDDKKEKLKEMKKRTKSDYYKQN